MFKVGVAITVAGLALALPSAASAAVISPLPPAGLFQPSSAGGCAAPTDLSTPCGGTTFGADTRGIHPLVLAASPDGKDLYIGGDAAASTTTRAGYAVLGLARDAKTGALNTLGGTTGCVATRNTGLTGCGPAIEPPPTDPGIVDMIVSPDGRNIYAAAQEVLYTLARDPATGGVSRPVTTSGVCLTGASQFFPGCTLVHANWQPERMAFSSDGRFMYVASGAYGTPSDPAQLTVFARDATTGALTQVAGSGGCVVEDAVPGTPCGTARGMTTCGRLDVIVSPDGANVYFSSDALDILGAAAGCDPGSNGGIVAFSRDATTGALTQLSGAAGCLRASVAAHTPAYPIASCGTARAVGGANALAIDSSGADVYVSAWPSVGSSTISVLQRSATTGALTDLPGSGGCLVDRTLTNPLGCGTATGLWPTNAIRVSADGTRMYTTGFCSSSDPESNSTCAVTGNGGLAVLVRNTGTGAISQPSGGGPWVPDQRYAVSVPEPYFHTLDAGQPGLATAPAGGTMYVVDPWDDRVDVFAPAPTCADVAVGTLADTPVKVPLQCSDSGTGIPFFISGDVNAPSQRGKVTGWPAWGVPGLSATVTYTPYNGSNAGPFQSFPFGTDTFGYFAHELSGTEASAAATVTVSIPKIQIIEGPLLLFKKDLLKVRGGEALVTLTCPRSANGGAIVTLRLAPRGQARIAAPAAGKKKRPVILGSHRFWVRAGRTVTLGVPLSRAARHYLSVHHRLTAWLTAVTRMGIGTSKPRTITQRVTLHS